MSVLEGNEDELKTKPNDRWVSQRLICRSSSEKLAPCLRGCIAGGRTPAKPPWSEVMIFINAVLRRVFSLTEKDGNSDFDALKFSLS